MKKIIFFLFLAFGMQSAIAECSFGGLTFFPSTKEISLNSIFIIEGYGDSQKTINSFKGRSVYLESESGELIELNLQEILTGKMYLIQAIFCPALELKPNTTYFLKYADQTEYEGREITRYNRDKKESEKVYWKTSDEKTTVPLNANMSIEFETTEVESYGCGPSANAIFNVKNKSTFEIWYKTEVVELETNNKTTYYIKEWNGKLNVGHGMCAGAFTYKNEGKYKVRFTPMNTDGKALKTTEWKTYESPYLNDTSFPW